jgi:hypothetical protein
VDKIYEGAERVIGWLRPTADDSDYLMVRIQRWHEESTEDQKRTIDSQFLRNSANTSGARSYAPAKRSFNAHIGDVFG